MRAKTLIKGLAVAAGVLAGGSALAAGISNTKHDMVFMQKTAIYGATFTPRGVCSFCHVPHGAKGSRLWAGTVGAGTTPVGNLCATCHLDGNIVAFAHEGQNMFQATSHGYSTTASYAELGQGFNVAASTWPYATEANIDCSSCHNPHTGDRRTFLQADHLSFCSVCHTGRNSSGTNARMFSNVADASGYSTHPSGAVYTGYTRSATAPITWATPYRAPWATALNSTVTGTNLATAAYRTSWWVLGGHRADGNSSTTIAAAQSVTSGVICMSCHVVHGTDPNSAVMAPSGTYANQQPANKVLVKEAINVTGATFPNNNVCIDCHGIRGGNATLGTHPTAGLSNTNYTGENTNNRLDIPTGMMDAIATAPSSSKTFGTDGITCLSCHDIHYGKANTPSFVDSSLASTGDSVCRACHNYDAATGSGVIVGGRHHPANGSTAYDTATYVARADTSSNYQNALGCNTCHRAHNAAAQGLAGTAQMALRAANFNTTNGQPTSAICVACHSVNPARFTYSVESGKTSAEYGSHWVSMANAMSTLTASALPASWVVATTGYDASTVLGIQKNGVSGGAAPERITNWPATGATYTGTWAFSKYGSQAFSWQTTGPAARGGMLCESCHSITNPRFDGSVAAPRSYFLLGQYAGQQVAMGANRTTDNTTLYSATTQTAQGGDGLCLGCHGIPTGTHPTTGNTIGRRNGAVLSTQTATVSYILNPPAGGEAYYPGTDEMTCGSCHDVHSGNTGGSYYILKQGASGTSYSTGTTALSLNYGVQGSSSTAATSFHTAPIDFTDLCAACHSGYR